MTDRVKVTSSNTYRKKLQQLDAGVRQGLTKAGRFFINRVRRTFQAFSPRGHASGRTIRSLTVSPVKIINGVYSCRAGPTTEYSWWLHEGTGPAAGHGPRKQPPVDAIYEWIKEKGLVPTFTTSSKATIRKGRFGRIVRTTKARKSRSRKDVERDRRALAFLIARKIGRDGTKPFPFMTATYKAVKTDMEKIVVSEIIKSLR